MLLFFCRWQVRHVSYLLFSLRVQPPPLVRWRATRRCEQIRRRPRPSAAGSLMSHDEAVLRLSRTTRPRRRLPSNPHGRSSGSDGACPHGICGRQPAGSRLPLCPASCRCCSDVERTFCLSRALHHPSGPWGRQHEPGRQLLANATNAAPTSSATPQPLRQEGGCSGGCCRFAFLAPSHFCHLQGLLQPPGWHPLNARW